MDDQEALSTIVAYACPIVPIRTQRLVGAGINTERHQITIGNHWSQSRLLGSVEINAGTVHAQPCYVNDELTRGFIEMVTGGARIAGLAQACFTPDNPETERIIREQGGVSDHAGGYYFLTGTKTIKG